MKVDRTFYENQMFYETKRFKLEMISDEISTYIDVSGTTDVLFETATNELIGYISRSDVRISRKTYYNARLCYGWDGKTKTKKTFLKTLCTRADYNTASAMLMDAYKSIKNN